MSKKKPFVMYLFLAIQLIVYVIGMSPTGQLAVYSFGVKEATVIAYAGEYWRFITPIFIHFGFEHLLLNSIMLYFLGREVEWQLGHWRFFVLYLLSGIMGNLFSYQFSTAISAGASTSLFGLFAYFIAMDYLAPHNPYYHAMGQQYKLLLIINIIGNLMTPGIDIWGHMGGFVGGFLATLIVDQQTKEAGFDWRIVTGIGVFLIIATTIILNHGVFNTLFR